MESIDFRAFGWHEAHGNAAMSLACHRPHIVCAGGESLRSERGTIALELMRHGFAEWAGIRHVDHITGVGVEGELSSAAVTQLRAAFKHSEDDDGLPIFLCRDNRLPSLLADDSPASTLALIGHPLQADSKGFERGPVWFKPPLPLPSNVDPGSLAWLGAPDALVDSRDGFRPALITSLRALGPDSVGVYLAALGRFAARRQTSRLWVVVYLDRLRAGRSGPGFIDDEVLAATLGWLQRQVCDPVLVLHSSRPAPLALRSAFGPLARHLGQALFRETGCVEPLNASAAARQVLSPS